MFQYILSLFFFLTFTFGYLESYTATASKEQLEEIIENYSSRANKWDGPTSGPKAVKDKMIVIIGTSLTNGGVLGVIKGMEEAAKAVGWKVRVLDGLGTVSGNSAAFGQALALKPDGIAAIGVDLKEQQGNYERAAAAHIPMVTWHVGSKNGPQPEGKIFANVTTDPMEVARAAAVWAYLNSKDKLGVIIFTDSTYEFAIAKAKKMKEVIENLGGEVLEWVDTPLADTSIRMPLLTASLLQKYGTRWTHSLAINDLYYDFMRPALVASRVPAKGPPVNIAAGDGSESAFQRIRAGQYQAVTVAEPLNLQGWQVIDELNRVISQQPWSGYQTKLHLVTKNNIQFDGGQNNIFDPENSYREEYKKIWGVK